MFFVVKNLLIY